MIRTVYDIAVQYSRIVIMLRSEVGCEPVHTTRELVPTSVKF